MKLATYGPRWQERVALVSEDGQWLVDVNLASQGRLPADMLALLEQGDREALEALAAKGLDVPREALKPLKEVRLGAPVPLPRNVICLGLNYHDHAAEGGHPIPERPILFMKASTCLIGPYDDIVLPRTVGQVDYELELAFVVGRKAKGVSPEEAPNYIAGYVVFNDVTSREAQFGDGQWFRGKSCDTFGPMGPYLVSPDQVGDVHQLDMWLTLNGQEMQRSNTSNLIFNVYQILAFITENITLYPGDVVSTGTPGGVGIFRQPPVLLKPGDVVEAHIQNIGSLRNRVVAEE